MSAGGGGGDGDVDLNLAPIIDCFTVLIAYLLVSMSFISLGIFDAEVAASGPPPENPPAQTTPPEVPLSFAISLSEHNSVELKLTGGKENLNQIVTVEPKGNIPDVDTVKTKVAEIVQAHADLKEANISADPTIRYKTIIKVIEAVKAKLPKVFLAS